MLGEDLPRFGPSLPKACITGAARCAADCIGITRLISTFADRFPSAHAVLRFVLNSGTALLLNGTTTTLLDVDDSDSCQEPLFLGSVASDTVRYSTAQATPAGRRPTKGIELSPIFAVRDVSRVWRRGDNRSDIGGRHLKCRGPAIKVETVRRE